MDIFNKPSGSFSHSTVFNTMAEWEHWKKTVTHNTYYTYSEPYEVVERI